MGNIYLFFSYYRFFPFFGREELRIFTIFRRKIGKRARALLFARAQRDTCLQPLVRSSKSIVEVSKGLVVAEGAPPRGPRPAAAADPREDDIPNAELPAADVASELAPMSLGQPPHARQVRLIFDDIYVRLLPDFDHRSISSVRATLTSRTEKTM